MIMHSSLQGIQCFVSLFSLGHQSLDSFDEARHEFLSSANFIFFSSTGKTRPQLFVGRIRKPVLLYNSCSLQLPRKVFPDVLTDILSFCLFSLSPLHICSLRLDFWREYFSFWLAQLTWFSTSFYSLFQTLRFSSFPAFLHSMIPCNTMLCSKHMFSGVSSSNYGRYQ